MHHAYRCALAAACAFTWLPGMASAAAPAPPAFQSADANAAVPATIYRSAIARPPATAPDTSPDRSWVASNATVAGYNSMSLTMKMRGMPAHGAAAPAAAAPAAAPPPAPAAPVAAPAPAPVDPHAGHDIHDMHDMHAGHGAAPAGPAPQRKESP